jgi:type I restriction enzyme, S subunit
MSPDSLLDEAAIEPFALALPAGWTGALLSEVAMVNPSTDLGHFPEDAEIPFVPMAAVVEETGIIDFSRRRPIAEVRKGYVRFSEGDVIFAKITPCMENGKTAPVHHLAGGYAAGSTEFHVLRPTGVAPKYLWYWLVRRAFRREAQRNMSGSAGQLRVPARFLAGSPIPVAPFAEQRRIAARIDELFGEIAEGEAVLESARRALDTWRRALLKAAVTGELTRDWRETNRPTETGADLLARIQSKNPGCKSARRRTRSALPEAVDSVAFAELPNDWAWGRLGDLGEIVGGVTVDQKRKPLNPVEVPYLRVANVQRGHLDLTEIKTIRVEQGVAARLKLLPGDVLLNEGGDRDKIGRGWVWEGQVPGCIHQNHVFRVRLHEGISPYFVSHYANEMGRRFFIEKGKQTTNLASISLSKISELPVPVPPAPEVSAIVDRLNEALAAELDCRRELADGLALAQSQRQSILKAAFEGRLVPRDPADEPASALLARLRASNPPQTRSQGRGRQQRMAV